MYLLLREMKLNVREMHTRKPQLSRARVSEEFKESKRLILITSDVSSHGMNYPDVTLVIQVFGEAIFVTLKKCLVVIPVCLYLGIYSINFLVHYLSNSSSPCKCLIIHKGFCLCVHCVLLFLYNSYCYDKIVGGCSFFSGSVYTSSWKNGKGRKRRRRHANPCSLGGIFPGRVKRYPT